MGNLTNKPQNVMDLIATITAEDSWNTHVGKLVSREREALPFAALMCEADFKEWVEPVGQIQQLGMGIAADLEAYHAERAKIIPLLKELKTREAELEKLRKAAEKSKEQSEKAKPEKKIEKDAKAQVSAAAYQEALERIIPYRKSQLQAILSQRCSAAAEYYSACAQKSQEMLALANNLSDTGATSRLGDMKNRMAAAVPPVPNMPQGNPFGKP